MKKTNTLILCSLMLPLWIFAQQAEDHVVVDGKGHYVRADPLYRYLCNGCREDLLDEYILAQRETLRPEVASKVIGASASMSFGPTPRLVRNPRLRAAGTSPSRN